MIALRFSGSDATAMPYEWTHATPATPAEPVARLRIWPHQSLTGRGFVVFIAATAVMLALPLLALLGSPVTWVLMAFFAATLAGVWIAIMRNRRHRSLHEELDLWPDRIRLHHVQPAHDPLEWEANPYWVSVHLHEKGGPVENYLTLKGNNREVEIGAFLSPEEREALYHELIRALRDLK